MNRLVKNSVSSVLAIAVSASLAACGAGSHSAAMPQTAPTATPAPPYNGPLADATFKITIPGPVTPTAGKRRPQYVSSATKSLKFVINSSTTVTGTATTGTLGAYNALAWHLFNTGTLPSAACPASGADFVCTVAIKLPPGTDNMTMTAYDNTGGTGNILSQQIQNFTVTAGGSASGSNNFSTTLDANINTLVVNGSGSCQGGTVGSVFGSVGTSPVTFTISLTDPAGKTPVAPGMPKLEIQDNTATYQTSSGTINGTGGTVGFTINQAAQSFTLTPSGSSITNASINLKEVPANTNGTGDGLGGSFPAVKTFAFSTGPAPPTHNFLAAVEQTGAASGQVDFFNVSLGGNTSGSDTFSAFSPATLAVTASNGGSGPNDVDNPLDLRWDSSGDLLIANAGVGAGDNGNLACVPVGAIATGANTSTTVVTNVDNPRYMAYDSRDGSVALANQPVGAPVEMPEFLLTGNYVAASGTGPGTRNLVASGFGTFGITEIPDLAAGTYAVAIEKGAEEDPAHAGTTGSNKIAIYSPTGGETDIQDDTAFTVDEPWGLAYDATGHQLVISNFSTWHRVLSFYTVSGTPTLVKSIVTTHRNLLVATSPSGKVAVVWNSSFGMPQIQVYDIAANNRNAIGGPIPFNGTTTSCGSTYTYGDSGGLAINALKWLSDTKLLVALNANTAGSQNANNGLYVFDTSNLTVAAGFDDVSCSAFAASPTNTGFVHLGKKPFGIAFKT
jgi:hypothetical protein